MLLKMEAVEVNDSMEVSEPSSEEDGSSGENEDSDLKTLTETDKDKIDGILSCKMDEKEMKVVLEKLPRSTTTVLLRSILRLLQKKINYTQTGLAWLRVLYEVHQSMFTDPKLKRTLRELHLRFEDALSLRNPLNSLKGKLDLLLYQVDNAREDRIDEEPETLAETFDEQLDENTSDVLNGYREEEKVLTWDDEWSDDEVEKSDGEMDTVEGKNGQVDGETEAVDGETEAVDGETEQNDDDMEDDESS